jgi:general secretion pathway protein G
MARTTHSPLGLPRRAAASPLPAQSKHPPAPSKRSFADQRGFTLIELLVVIIVLGLLVGIVGPRLWGRVAQSKTAVARAQIANFEAALDQFRLDKGRYPNTAETLQAIRPYLKKAIPNDPWGNPYKYLCCPGQHGDYDLWAEGADGAPGGEGENADVTSWDEEK